MSKDKQRSHRERPHRLWFHRRTTILCVCTLAQSEACRQATTEALQHNMEGGLPKALLCKQTAEDYRPTCVDILYDTGKHIQKVQCSRVKPDRKHWEHEPHDFIMSHSPPFSLIHMAALLRLTHPCVSKCLCFSLKGSARVRAGISCSGTRNQLYCCGVWCSSSAWNIFPLYNGMFAQTLLSRQNLSWISMALMISNFLSDLINIP